MNGGNIHEKFPLKGIAFEGGAAQTKWSNELPREFLARPSSL